jgi:hypothetical protein
MSGFCFLYQAEVNIGAEKLYWDTVRNTESIPRWNPTVLEMTTLESVDENTEISYNVAAAGARGTVASR